MPVDHPAYPVKGTPVVIPRGPFAVLLGGVHCDFAKAAPGPILGLPSSEVPVDHLAYPVKATPVVIPGGPFAVLLGGGHRDFA